MTFTLPEQYQDGEFLQHLTVRLVKSATDQWWDGYARLAAHYATFGHTRISGTVLAEDGFRLGAWVKACRVAYRQNRLAPDRITALEKVDFVFDPLQAQADERWEKGLVVARGFYAENGHLRPPNGFRRNGITLGQWLTRYRREAQRGELAEDRKKLLTDMDMDWRGVRTWDDRIRELKDFHTRHGRFATASDADPEAARLYAMQSRLRMARKKDRLSEALIEELDQLGFEWDTAATPWRTGLAAAAAFREQHGHLCPGRYAIIDGVNVYEWTVNRRQDHKAGRLTDAEFAALDELGMIWGSVDEAAWNSAFAAASEFHATHGHLRIPERTMYTDHRGKRADLKAWIHRQRDFHRAGSLTTKRFKKLDALGLDWRPSQSRWETNLAALQEFYATYGHLNVPPGHRNTPDGPNLANVLTHLRVRKRAGDLDNERIEALEALGIDWNPGSRAWNSMIATLREYHAEQGTIHTPADCCSQDGVNIQDWLTRQRNLYKRGKLTSQQIDTLNELGMVWDAHAARWMSNLGAAQQYRAAHGHLIITHLSAAAPEIRKLYSWIRYNRLQHEAGKLRPWQSKELEKLGVIGNGN
ncbi:helicase associated domain-containing protein [Saccharopolyspora shandongensis]|uniref:helicase associated domain-containing protein n=1 Tax=Saccharopolyspora shandongensis TaxID=418495 RepID=UPI0034155037